MPQLILDKEQLIRYRTGIISLFSTCFGREFSEEAWDWAYLHGVLGDPVVALSFYGEKVVGHYAAIPFSMRASDGSRIRTALSMTTMIDPMYRQHQGGIMSLANQVYEYLKDDNVEFIFAFPNCASSPVFKLFFGWRIDETSRLVTVNGRQLNDLNAQRAIAMRKEYIMDTEDEEFLQWRLNKPGCDYFKEGGSILKRYDNSIDILYDDGGIRKDKKQKFNVIVNSEDALVGGEQYHFGVKPLKNQSIQPCDIKCDMILSDVF